MFFIDEIAIDLGTANILVYKKSKGLIYNEPSYIAQNTKNKSVVALGVPAKEMLGRTNTNIMTSRPLIDGVISEYECVYPMIKEILKKHQQRRKGKMTISVPNGVSEIEMRAVMDLGYQLGYKKLEIVDEPIVAALGEGVNINQAKGHMIVDIGAGTTDIAVISLGSIVVGKSIKVASDDFDEAIVKLMRDKYKLSIGKLTAESIKIQYTKMIMEQELLPIETTGLNVIKGVPEKKQIRVEEITESIVPLVDLIVDGIHEIMEETEPELIADIIDSGIILTGGGSMIPMVYDKITSSIDIPVRLSNEPLNSVGNGLKKKLNGYRVRPKDMKKDYEHRQVV